MTSPASDWLHDIKKYLIIIIVTIRRTDKISLMVSLSLSKLGRLLLERKIGERERILVLAKTWSVFFSPTHLVYFAIQQLANSYLRKLWKDISVQLTIWLYLPMLVTITTTREVLNSVSGFLCLLGNVCETEPKIFKF